jgi:hypothetical protein
MRYELKEGPLDGTKGEVDDTYEGNLHFPHELPTPEGHDPRTDPGAQLRYRKTESVTDDGAHVYEFDSVQHRE